MLKTQFQPFVKLSDDKQGALYKTLYEILYHDELVTVLEDMVRRQDFFKIIFNRADTVHYSNFVFL